MAKKTDYTALTEQVCDLLGGKSNIGYFTHCVTRLRFSIKDKGLVKEDELRSMEGVGGLRWVGTQLQIIIGSGVEEVYTAICKKHGFTEESAVDETLDDVKEKPKGIKGYFSAFVATLSAILGPIIPAIVACGLLQDFCIRHSHLAGLIQRQQPIHFSLRVRRHPFISCRF